VSILSEFWDKRLGSLSEYSVMNHEATHRSFTDGESAYPLVQGDCPPTKKAVSTLGAIAPSVMGREERNISLKKICRNFMI
jgi:hypothetical protein